MAKYWKLLGALLVVGVLAAVMVAAVPAAKGGQNVPRLIPLFEETVNLSPGGEATTPFLNTHDCGSLSVFMAADSSLARSHIVIDLIVSGDGEGEHGLIHRSGALRLLDVSATGGKLVYPVLEGSRAPLFKLSPPFTKVRFFNDDASAHSFDKAWMNCTK